MRKRIITLTEDAKLLLKLKDGDKLKCPSCGFEGTYDTADNAKYEDSIWYNGHPEEKRFECVWCWLRVVPLDQPNRWWNKKR